MEGHIYILENPYNGKTVKSRGESRGEKKSSVSDWTANFLVKTY